MREPFRRALSPCASAAVSISVSTLPVFPSTLSNPLAVGSGDRAPKIVNIPFDGCHDGLLLQTRRCGEVDHREVGQEAFTPILFIQAHDAEVPPDSSSPPLALVLKLERATRLHITPVLLQSSDGRCSRRGNYKEFAGSGLGSLIEWTVAYTDRLRPQLGDDAPEACRRQATKLVHKLGGITKAASTLIFATSLLRNTTMLKLLRSEHSPEDQAVVAVCKATIFGGAQDCPAILLGTIGEVDEPFGPEDVRAAIKTVHSVNSPSPSGLRFNYL